MNDTVSLTSEPLTDRPAEAAERLPAALLDHSDYSRYLLSERNEILQVLKALIEQMAQVTLFFNEGKDLLPTALIAVDQDGLVLDYGPSPDVNQRAQEADKLFAITSQDRVKVQFVLRGLKRIDYEGQPAFRAPFPESVLRLQRREYYRLTMPVTRPLVCQIPVTQANGQLKVLGFNAVDISGGGVALAFDAKSPSLALEVDFPGCVIDLPDVGRIVATLRVKAVLDITLRSGAQLQRAGCQFVNLPGPMLTLIQRYILKVERERKARESGLA